MAEFDKKIATEAEFFEIIKPFDDVPSELSNGICLRKDKIQKYTEKTFDSLNSYTNNQLVPLATFVDVGNADYVLFSFEWEGEHNDLDCIVKTSNFDKDYIGIGCGVYPPYGGYYKNPNYRPNEIIQWSGDVRSSGGEYFLIDMKKLKEYKKKYGLTNNYFDFDIYAGWFLKLNNTSEDINLKITSIIADNVQKQEYKKFKFTNEKITHEIFEYKFKTKASLSQGLGDIFYYDLIKRIRCFESFAIFLPYNFPKIKSLENLTKTPKIIVNGIDKSPSYVSHSYDINNVKTGDKIKITLYKYSIKKITIDENGNEETSYKHTEIKEIGPFEKPSSDILTCDYYITDDRTEMTIDINVIDFSHEKITNKYVRISFYFFDVPIKIDLNIN